MKIEIVKMQKDHIKILAELERECFSEPWSETGLKAELDNKNAYFTVAKSDDEILGYAGMHCVLGEGYIANVAVFPKYRHQGVGKNLLCELINYAEKNRFSFITLEVRKSNAAALNLYKALDFEIMGYRKNFYKNPMEDGIIMTRKFN